MKLGATFTNTAVGTDFAVIRHIVQELEVAGFDAVATNDHVIGAHPDRSEGVTMNTVHTAVHEPIVLLSMIGAVTTRLELVSAIVIAPQRQTVLLAKQAAQLDLLSNQRLRLGIGVGRNWIEYESLNEDFRTRGKRIEEQVEVMRRLWADELVTFEGRWHHLDRVGINPRPTRPAIPIWMGSYFGGVSERVLERVGRVADGWMPQFPPEELAPVLERVRGYASDAGRDPATLGVECSIRANADDPADRWVELAEQYRGLGASHLRVLPALPPDASPQDQLEVMLRWYEAVAPTMREGWPVRELVTATVHRTFKPLQQFTRGWMMAQATDQYGVDLGFRSGKQFWIVGRAGVLGSCPPEVAASALAFHAPEHVHDAWASVPSGLDHRAVATHYHGRIVEWGDRVMGSFDRDRMTRLDELGRRIIDAAPVNLGPLFAGWRVMPIPDGHGARVALTTHVLREMRGAAHSVAVVAMGLSPLDAILASTNAPPRTGPPYAEAMGFTGPFRDPEEVRAPRLEAEALTERIMATYYDVLDDQELTDFGDLVETTRNAIDM